MAGGKPHPLITTVRTVCVSAAWLVGWWLAAGAASAAEHPARVLLRTQVAYIVECLQMNEPEFAAAHLDVIRERFPDEVRIITYYEGVLAFRGSRWADAIAAFAKLPPRDGEDDSDVLYYLFHAHLKLGHIDKAELAVRTVEKLYGETTTTVDARILLARTIFEEPGGDARAYALVAGLAAKFPQHPQRTWLLWAHAEDHWNAAKRRLPADATPPAAELSTELRQLTTEYEAVRQHNPASDEATAAGYRILEIKRHLD